MKREKLRRYGALLFLSLFLLGFSAAAFGDHREQRDVRNQPNVIIIVLDQFRADQAHSYGNPRPTTPNIDKLATRGIRFSHFYTVAPWTAPSFSSLHTSLYPSRHGVTLLWKPGMPLIDKDTPMLIEAFRDHGYYTAAFVENSLAGQDLTGRGFDEYHANYAEAVNITEREVSNRVTTAPGTTEEVLSWLDKHRSDQFVLYVHFLEPHSPYDPPPEYDMFKSDAYPYMNFTGYGIDDAPLTPLAMLGDKQAIERLYQLYDGKIRFVDHYVGEILDRVKALGLDDHTVVALTSDHGELLYSHPRDFLTFDHCSLYDAVLHIPLIIAGPGLPEGKVVDGIASNVDTAPTLLDLAGLPNLPDAEGKSLVPLFGKTAPTMNSYIYAEEDIAVPERSIRTERYKLILNLLTGEKQLFDLQSDPGELDDIARTNPTVVAELYGQLEKWMQENQPSQKKQVARWRIYTAPENVIVTDDLATGGAVLLTGGGWHSDESPASGNYKGHSFWTEAGDGSRSALWRTDDPFVGSYRIFAYFGQPRVGKLASDAPFEIVTRSGSKVVHVNFAQGAGEWKLLGTFEDPVFVRVTNAADGVIIADAVKFERID